MRNFSRLMLVSGVLSIVLALYFATRLISEPLKTAALADLRIDAVSVSELKSGNLLHLRLQGRGFDSLTRVSLTLDTGNQRAILADLKTPGHIEQVKTSGHLAYLAANRQGVLVADVSNPRHPRLIGGETQSFKAAWDLEVDGRLLFVSDVAQGLIILDVSDPAHPRPIGSYRSDDRSFGLSLMPDGYLLLAQGLKGVLILDVSDPSRPRKAGQIPARDFVWNVAVREQTVFVADGRTGLQIYDVSDPLRPRSLAQFAAPKYAYDIDLQDNLLFLTDSQKGLLVFDIDDPANPLLRGELALQGRPRSVKAEGSLVYVSADRAGLYVVAVDDSAQPRVLGQILTGFSARNVAKAGANLLVADGQNGLRVISPDLISSRHFLYELPSDHEVSALAAADDRLYAAQRQGGLQSFQVDPLSPTPLGDFRMPFARGIQGVAFADYLFLASGELGLQVLKVPEPGRVKLVGSLPLEGFIHEVLLLDEGRTALVAAGPAGVQVLDVSQPHRPVRVNALDTLGNVIALLPMGEQVMALERGGRVHVLDCRQANNPLLVRSFAFPDVLVSFALLGDSLVVGTEKRGLYLLDLATLDAPLIFKNVLPELRAVIVHVSGSFLYAIGIEGVGRESLYVFEHSEDGALKQISHRDGYTGSFRIQTLGNALYVQQGHSLEVWDQTNPHGAHPVKILPQTDSVSFMIPAGKLAYLLFEKGGMQLLDISDPLDPQRQSLALPGLNSIIGLRVFKDHLMALDRVAGLHIFAMTPDGGLHHLTSLQFSRSLKDWSIEGDRLLLLDMDARLMVFDIANPARPEPLETLSFELESPTSVASLRNLLFLADRNKGLQVWNMADAQTPTFLGETQIPWPKADFAAIEDMVVWGERILVANGKAGLSQFEFKEGLRHTESLDLAGHCRKIRLFGDLALIHSFRVGIHIVDLSNPRKLVHLSTIHTTESITDFLLADDKIWLAQPGGIKAVPLPVLAQRVILRSSGEMEAEFSLPPAPGTYTVRVMRGREIFELPGALSFAGRAAPEHLSMADTQNE